MVARSAGSAVSLVAAIVSSRARDIRSITDFITSSACDTSAEAALTIDDQAVILACFVQIVAHRRAPQGSSANRITILPRVICVISLQRCSALLFCVAQS